MSDLLKQAIADAKAVRATALANAKAALEEAFTPKIQSMLAEKLRNELVGEEEEVPVVPAPGGEVDAVPGEEAGALAPAAPVGAVGAGNVDSVPPAAPVGDVGAEVPPAAQVGDTGISAQQPLVPSEPSDEEATEKELEDEMQEDAIRGTTSSELDPTMRSNQLQETDKASPDYKKTTSGHKTEDPGKKMVKPVGAAIGGTKGGPKEAGENRKASPNYKTMSKGNEIKNIKSSGTEDPQGASKELTDGPTKDDKTSTQALEENQEIDNNSLDEILKELEKSVNDCNTGVESVDPVASPVTQPTEEMDEEINLESLLEETEEDEKNKKFPWDKEEEEDEDEEDKKDKEKESLDENISLKKELEEYRTTVVYLRDRINEVNLLNAKLLYTNKLFKQVNMTNEQKLKIIESFDLTKSVREAKLVYATLAESINSGVRKTDTKKFVSGTVKTITEGLASKLVASTKPTKPVVLTEGAIMANRFKKLAGITR